MKKRRLFAAILAASTVICANAPAWAADDMTDTAPDSETDTTSAFVLEDVSKDAWYADAVQFVVENDLMRCEVEDVNRYFKPEQEITRVEVAEAIYADAQLYNIVYFRDEVGWKVRSLGDFAEVDESSQKAVAFCYNTKIMEGDTNRRIYPNKSITRQEFAVVLRRYLQYMEDQNIVTGVQSMTGVAVEEFTDAAAIRYWAKDDIAFCIKNDLLHGNADGSFNPLGDVTRAQMAQALWNFTQKLQ